MTAPSTGAVGDARKCDQETHHDPAVRALIAEAVQAERERIAVAIDAPTPRPQGPCPVAVRHRWAWLTDGRQACGYCGRYR